LTEGVTTGRFKIGAWLVGEHRDTAFDGSSEVDNPLRERTRILLPFVTFDLRMSDRMGVQLAGTIPAVTRTAVLDTSSGHLNYRESFRGFGDTSARAWYRLNPIGRWYPLLNVGVSLPTGRTETPRFHPQLDNGSLVPMSRLQRGSGTWDPVFGASFTRNREPWTHFASVAARTPIYDNRHGLRTGASFEINSGGARFIGTHRVALFGRIGWLHRQQDVFRGTRVLVGGGDWLYATPGVAILAGKGLNVQAEVKVPIYRSLANTQLDSSAIFQVGVSRAF
jgi:hypothetical protein